MKQKIINYLNDRAEPVSAVQIMRDVLKMETKNSTAAKAIVDSIVASEISICRDDNGCYFTVIDKKAVSLPEEKENIIFVKILPQQAVHWKKWGVFSYAVCQDFQIQKIVVWNREIDDFDDLADIFNALLKFSEDRFLFDGEGNQISMFRKAVGYLTGNQADLSVYSYKNLQRFLQKNDGISIDFLSHELEQLHDISPKEMEILFKEFTEQIAGISHVLENKQGHAYTNLWDYYETLQINKFDFSKCNFDENDIRELPTVPGVYLMYNRKGDLFYVGKAKNLKNRISSYFTGFDESDKAKTIQKLLHELKIIPTGSELEALLLEQEWIKKENPGLNTQLQTHERRHLQKNRYPRIIFLPSAQPEKFNIYLINPPGRLLKIELGNEFDENEIAPVIDDIFFANDPQNSEYNESFEIACSWLSINNDTPGIDMRHINTVSETVRLVRDYLNSLSTLNENIIHY